MKDLNLLIWLTQLGFSVAMPLAGFILLGIWLHQSCGMGVWTVWAGIGIGLGSAISGFRNAIRAMAQMSKDRKNNEPPPVSFNDHQ